MELAKAMKTADKNTCDIQKGNFTGRPKEAAVNHISKEQENNVITVEASFTMVKSTDIKMKSAFAVAKEARSQETLLTWKLPRLK